MELHKTICLKKILHAFDDTCGIYLHYCDDMDNGTCGVFIVLKQIVVTLIVQVIMRSIPT